MPAPELPRKEDLSSSLVGTRKRYFKIGPVKMFTPPECHAPITIDLEYLSLLIGNGGLPTPPDDVPEKAYVLLEVFDLFKTSLTTTYETVAAAKLKNDAAELRLDVLDAELAALVGWENNENVNYITKVAAKLMFASHDAFVEVTAMQGETLVYLGRVLDRHTQQLAEARAWADIQDKPVNYPTSWELIKNKPSLGGGSGGSIQWQSIGNKPLTFPADLSNLSVPWSKITGIPPEVTSGGQNSKVEWNSILNKPLVFPADLGAINVAWSQITNKPGSFPVDPSTLNIDWSQITSGVPTTFPADIPAATWAGLPDKPDVFPADNSAIVIDWSQISTGVPVTFPVDNGGIVIDWSQINTGVPATFPHENGAVAIDWSQITSGVPDIFPADVSAVPWANLTGKPNTFTPSAHNHDVTVMTKASGAFTVPSFQGVYLLQCTHATTALISLANPNQRGAGKGAMFCIRTGAAVMTLATAAGANFLRNSVATAAATVSIAANSSARFICDGASLWVEV
ncbi:MAG: hypothetical protein NT086_13665 [Proteobacteria bacterium]|nr:hypothetical protein [Pseudomonadota bacterium]